MKTLFFCLSLFIYKVSSSSILLPHHFPDTSIAHGKKAHKLDKEGFLKAFGRDDSAKALIRFYFLRRRNAKRMILFPIAPSALVTTLLMMSVNKSQSQNNSSLRDDYSGLFIAVLIGCAAGATFALGINGAVMLMLHSRKKLLKLLNNHFDGKPMPQKIVRSKFFRILLSGDIIKHHRLPNPFHKKKQIAYRDNKEKLRIFLGGASWRTGYILQAVILQLNKG